VIVDCAVYSAGRRHERERSLAGLRSEATAAGGFAWVGLAEPTPEEFDRVAREFLLHELAVEDAVKAHQRAKLERYGDTLFLVVKTARYVGSEEVVEVGEIMAFLAPDFLITVRHGEAGGLGGVRERLERDDRALALGPAAALHALLDRVVDAYAPVVEGVREDIEEVEAEVFRPGGGNVQRIYKLRREVLEFHRATAPLGPALVELATAGPPWIPDELAPYLRDVADHAARVVEQNDSFAALLASILQANLTRVSVRQNEDMRRISAWVAIIAVPTMIAGIYGMNFDHMPELEWRFGYPAVLIVIASACGYLYVRFRRSGWL
jgi:magnesium transporter